MLESERFLALLREEAARREIDLMTFCQIEDPNLYLRKENRQWLRDHGYCHSISLGCRISESLCELVMRHEDEGFANYFRRHSYGRAEQLEEAAQRIALWIESQGYRAFVMPGWGTAYHDGGEPGVISHLALARLSGMGSLGDNGLLITPEFGPRVRLSTILTDCPIPVERRPLIDHCLHCGLCTKICPAGVILGRRFDPENPAPQYVDKEACRSYRDRREKALGTKACDLCLAVCPVGKSLPKPSAAQPDTK